MDGFIFLFITLKTVRKKSASAITKKQEGTHRVEKKRACRNICVWECAHMHARVSVKGRHRLEKKGKITREMRYGIDIKTCFKIAFFC